MAVNQKMVRILNKVLETGFSDEKAIAASCRKVSGPTR